MFLASWLDRRSANGHEGAPLFTSFRYPRTEGALARRDKPRAKTIPVNRRQQYILVGFISHLAKFTFVTSVRRSIMLVACGSLILLVYLWRQIGGEICGFFVVIFILYGMLILWLNCCYHKLWYSTGFTHWFCTCTCCQN